MFTVVSVSSFSVELPQFGQFLTPPYSSQVLKKEQAPAAVTVKKEREQHQGPVTGEGFVL